MLCLITSSAQDKAKDWFGCTFLSSTAYTIVFYVFGILPCSRPERIMLFKLPIMLLSNAPKFSLLCPNYAPLCPIMLHKKDHEL